MDTVKVIDTPYNNAISLINRTNELLVEHNIKDSTGVATAQLETTPANPAWLFALACGSLHTSWQQQLAKAYSALDPQNCEDDQVLVLAALAGIDRGDGTPSHITVELFNDGDEITVPYGTKFTENVTNHSWYLNKDVIIGGANRYAVVILYSNENGAFDVPSGTSFDCQAEGIEITATSVGDSFQGDNIESLASLRNRISTVSENNDLIMKAAKAIEQLGGIENCSIWFNSSSTEDLEVNNIMIPSRQAYIAIKGVDINNGLAGAYYKYLNVPATVGSHQSVYLRGLQELTVNYDVAQEVAVRIYVRVRAADMAVGAPDALAEQLIKWSGTLACGQNLTSQQVSKWLVDFPYAVVVGCAVGTETGFITDINPAQYCVWNRDTITVTEV